MIFNLFILICGVFACSQSVIFIKASTENPFLLASYRFFVAAIILTPFLIRDLKKMTKDFSLKLFRPAIIPGIALGRMVVW